MMRTKSCPRCKGDVVIDRDQYGWYEQCLQCGYMCEIKNIAETREKVNVQKRKLPADFSNMCSYKKV